MTFRNKNNIKDKIINHPHYQKVIYWTKLISVTGIAQVIVQAVGFISGILIIRLLSVEQYALYTLANTMLGTMTVLSDGGISAGVMTLGGKVWQDKQKLGAVLETGLKLRRKFAIFSLIISLPILIYLLTHHGANRVTTVLISASLIPAFFAALSDNLLQIPVKLHQAIKPLQYNQVQVSIGRLILTSLTLFAFPWAYIAIIATGIPRIWGNFQLKKIANDFADRNAENNNKYKEEIFKIVKKVLPGSIYYAISGQLTIWLISIFGQTTSIAQIGALGRLMVIFSLLLTIVTMLIVPRFSRLNNKHNLIIRKFIRIQILLLLIGGMIVLTTALFSNQFLWILGDKYYGLSKELLLIMISGAVSFIGMSTNGLLSSRGLIVPPIIFLPLIVSIQVITLFLIPLNSVIGVITYTIVTASAIYLIRLIYFAIQVKKI